MSEAALAVYHGKADAEVARRLLDHVNQRFRFSYVLGRPLIDELDNDDDDVDVDDDSDAVDVNAEDYGIVDLEATADVILNTRAHFGQSSKHTLQRCARPSSPAKTTSG